MASLRTHVSNTILLSDAFPIVTAPSTMNSIRRSTAPLWVASYRPLFLNFFLDNIFIDIKNDSPDNAFSTKYADDSLFIHF